MDLNVYENLFYIFRASSFAMNGNGNMLTSMARCNDQKSCLVVKTFDPSELV